MMKINSTQKTRILLLVILSLAIYIYFISSGKKPILETEIIPELGKRYSLLIDNERFPIKVDFDQLIKILILENTGKKPLDFPSRVKIGYLKEQENMSKVKMPRFRFYYNTPKEMKEFYRKENLFRLKRPTDWETVEEVVKWVYNQINFGEPTTYYPTQNAMELLVRMRDNNNIGFCAHYCYITVQALQSLGFFARHITNNGHEICEVFVPQYDKWVCLDPTYNSIYVDENNNKLSAFEISEMRKNANVKMLNISTGEKKPIAVEQYERLWVWLHNDLFTTSINIYDLPKYNVCVIDDPDDFNFISPGDLFTVFPEELYFPPSE